MSLSDKSCWIHSSETSEIKNLGFVHEVYEKENVKESIKELKEKLCKGGRENYKPNYKCSNCRIIYEIFGDKLI